MGLETTFSSHEKVAARVCSSPYVLKLVLYNGVRSVDHPDGLIHEPILHTSCFRESLYQLLARNQEYILKWRFFNKKNAGHRGKPPGHRDNGHRGKLGKKRDRADDDRSARHRRKGKRPREIW